MFLGSCSFGFVRTLEGRAGGVSVIVSGLTELLYEIPESILFEGYVSRRAEGSRRGTELLEASADGVRSGGWSVDQT